LPRQPWLDSIQVFFRHYLRSNADGSEGNNFKGNASVRSVGARQGTAWVGVPVRGPRGRANRDRGHVGAPRLGHLRGGRGYLGLESRLFVDGGSRGLIGCFPVPDSFLVYRIPFLCAGAVCIVGKHSLTSDSDMECNALLSLRRM
jgi:hypothetical protein